MNSEDFAGRWQVGVAACEAAAMACSGHLQAFIGVVQEPASFFRQVVWRVEDPAFTSRCKIVLQLGRMLMKHESAGRRDLPGSGGDLIANASPATCFAQQRQIDAR